MLVKRPIGLHVEEAEDKSVVVKRLTPELGAAKTRRIEVSGFVGVRIMTVFKTMLNSIKSISYTYA